MVSSLVLILDSGNDFAQSDNKGRNRFPGQPVSRILSSLGLRFTPAMETIAGFIPEDPRLGGHLSGLTISRQLVQPTRDSSAASRCSSLLGLAPGGGCPAAGIAARAGGLLHHHFTLSACAEVCFCGPIRQVAPPREFPRRHALWSADFPLPKQRSPD